MTRPAVQSLLCAESNLWHQGCLACYPDAQTLPRRDETQFLKKVRAHDDIDYEENMNNARRTLDITRAPRLPRKVTTPVNPNGSSWKRQGASDWSKN